MSQYSKLARIMRRLRLILAFGIGPLLWLPAVAGSGDAAITIHAERLTSRIWYFRGEPGMASKANRGFMSNAGFVVTDSGVLVFDALATPELASEMLDCIRRVTPLPIRIVVVSHYHADHVYGLQVFKDQGAEIWARREGESYLSSDAAIQRLEQRRRDLAPWVDGHTHLTPADRWLDLSGGQSFTIHLGGMSFTLVSGGSAHSPGDLMLSIPSEHLLFAGDLFFSGRLPFVVDGNTRQWLADLEIIEKLHPGIVVPGHGAASHAVVRDIKKTRDYLYFLRNTMGAAVGDLQSFDDAYAALHWDDFAAMPTFSQANRRNAYSVYLEMQAEALAQ